MLLCAGYNSTSGTNTGFLLLGPSSNTSGTCLHATAIVMLLSNTKKRSGDPCAFWQWEHQARALLSFSFHKASANTSSSTSTSCSPAATILAGFGFQRHGIPRSAGSTFKQQRSYVRVWADM